MPVFSKSVASPLAGDRLAIKLTAQSDREVADIDDFLNFAAGLGHDLTRFPGDKSCQVVLVLAKGITDSANELAAGWRRRVAPHRKAADRLLNRGFHLLGRHRRKLSQHAAIDRRANRKYGSFACIRSRMSAHLAADS